MADNVIIVLLTQAHIQEKTDSILTYDFVYTHRLVIMWNELHKASPPIINIIYKFSHKFSFLKYNPRIFIDFKNSHRCCGLVNDPTPNDIQQVDENVGA